MILMLKTESIQMRERANSNLGILTKALITLLAAFIIGNSTVSGIQSPLIASFVGGIEATSGIFAFIGAMTAYFFTGKIGLSIVQIASVIVILVVKIIFGELLSKNLKAAGCAVLTGVTYSLTGIVVVFVTTGNGAAGFLAVCQGIFCGCAAYFFKLFNTCIKQEHKLVFTGTYGACAASIYVLAVTALCSVSLGIFNLGRIAALIVVLMAARRFKHVGGAVSGALATCGMTLYSVGFGKNALLLAVAGLLAGVFSEFGMILTAFFFIGANAIGLIVLGVTPESARLLADVFVASIAFVLIPERHITNIVGASPASQAGAKIADIAASRLEFAAHTISDVKKSVMQISKALEKKSETTDISAEVCDHVCSNCRNCLYCWEKEFDRTAEAFQAVRKSVEMKKVISQEDLPQSLNNCFKKSALAENFNTVFAQKNQEDFAKAKIRDMRGILFEQFNVMEDMLTEISSELTAGKQLDENLSKEVTSFLQDFGAVTPRTCVFYDSFGHLSVEAFFGGKLKLTSEETALELSDVVGRELELPQFFMAKDYTKLCLMEKPSYVLEVGAVQKSSAESEPSGDTCEHFYDGKGNAYFIMSDGMGTGKMAAVDSMMTSNLIIRLLKAGIGYNAAAKLVNSSVLVKSYDESFATIDIACINLYTGKLDILKLGASNTFVKANGKIMNVQASTLPLGILEAPEFDKRGTVLKENDVVIMVSDGLKEDVYPYIRNELIKKEPVSSETFVNNIIEKANEKSVEKRDDMSVIIIKLMKNNC